MKTRRSRGELGKLQTATVADFWGQAVKRPSGCWEWAGRGLPKGCGRFQIDKKEWLAHRFSYFLAHGPIPEGLCVCHKCDNPKCVNPDHLFLGTNADNIADMRKKDRHTRGEKVAWARLCDGDVKEIRSKYNPYIVTAGQLAKEYGVNEKTIRRIVQGKTWKHLPVQAYVTDLCGPLRNCETGRYLASDKETGK